MYWHKTDRQDGMYWLLSVSEVGSSVSSTTQDGRSYCDDCQRSFSTSQDKVRHSCNSVRSCHAVGMRVLQFPVLIVDELFGDPRIWQGTVL